MDNSYYTGANLIRGGFGTTNGGGNHAHPSHKYSTTPPPLQNTGNTGTSPPLHHILQPNLLTGLPLIRNGHQQSSLHHHHHHHHHNYHQPPPLGHHHNVLAPTQGQGSVICCFQPIYYIPNPTQSGYNNPVPPSHPLLIPHNPGIYSKGQSGPPKRKNYKSLGNSGSHVKLKSVHSSPPGPVTFDSPLPPLHPYHHFSSEPFGKHTGHGVNLNSYHSKLIAASSFPDPISPPVKLAHHQLKRTYSTTSFLPTTTTIPPPVHFDLNNEDEKQKQDRLLNFYFYDKHWRPKDEGEDVRSSESSPRSSRSGEDDNEFHGVSTGWDILRHQNNLDLKTSSSEEEDEDNHSINLRIQNSSRFGGGTMDSVLNDKTDPHTQQRKDLEVEAQIVTLANGHRDLEIRLCYVTS